MKDTFHYYLEIASVKRKYRNLLILLIFKNRHLCIEK